MGDGFGLFPSSAVAFGVTCGTTTTAGYIQHWTIAPPLTMRDEPRKTWDDHLRHGGSGNRGGHRLADVADLPVSWNVPPFVLGFRVTSEHLRCVQPGRDGGPRTGSRVSARACASAVCADGLDILVRGAMRVRTRPSRRIQATVGGLRGGIIGDGRAPAAPDADR